MSRSTSVGDPTPQSIFMVSFCRQALGTRRLRGRAHVQSACPSAQNSPRSYVPQAPGGKARENAHLQRRRLCTFSRSVSDSVFRSVCIVCPFLLLHRVATCPVYQHASFWHILATPTLPYFCGCELDFFLVHKQTDGADDCPVDHSCALGHLPVCSTEFRVAAGSCGSSCARTREKVG